MSIPTPIDLPTLTAKIISESQNSSSELANEIPQIVRDAERICNTELELQINRVIADGNFYTAGDIVNGNTLLAGQTAYIYLPLDCVDVREFEWYTPAGSSPSTNGTDQYAGTINPLQRISEGNLSTYWPQPAVTGQPVYFYVTGQQEIYGTGSPSPLTGVIKVAPTPDKTYAYRLHYITQQESLVDLGPGQYNYLSTWYPHILFFSCMVRYAAFVKRADQAQTWAGIMQAAIKQSKLEEVRRKGETMKDMSETTEPLQTRNN